VTAVPGRASLAIEVGGTLFSLEDGHTYHVGRSPLCDLRLNHASVSERHSRLVCRGGVVTVEDLDSQNGTLIAGRKIRRQVVQPGQTMQCGAIELRLVATATHPGLALPYTAPSPRARFQQVKFSELMAEELRRAPWFTLSAVIHAIVLVILYHVFDELPHPQRARSVLSMLEKEELGELEPLMPPPETEIRAEDEVLDMLPIEDPFEEAFDAPEDESFDDEFEMGATGLAGGTHWLHKVKGKGVGVMGHAGVRAGGFGKTVSKIRRTGLETVFVFDSTGSMGSILQGTKERIAHMVEVLHELVPDARIGIVTYRDRDSSEEYLTRKVPLGMDVYRAINFMQLIDAGGGGNRPEAVLDGLREAFSQDWHKQARRVVVLIGDAPAHKFDRRKIKSLVQSFTANNRSFVHAIVTSPYGGDDWDTDTHKSFRQIAQLGRGECIGFEDESRVLHQVLSLAFGREFRKNIDEVSRILRTRKKKISTFALDMVRREDLEQIEAKLRATPVPDEIVKALASSQSKTVAHHLVDLLARRDFPQSGRQAAAHALTQILDGRLRHRTERVLSACGKEGAAPRRTAWKLGALPPPKAIRLRRLIDER
jgi:predicted component of type VI protein secretion system